MISMMVDVSNSIFWPMLFSGLDAIVYKKMNKNDNNLFYNFIVKMIQKTTHLNTDINEHTKFYFRTKVFNVETIFTIK